VGKNEAELRAQNRDVGAILPHGVKGVVSALFAVVTILLVGSNASATTTEQLLHSCAVVIKAAPAAKSTTVDIPAAGLPCWYYMSALQNMSALASDSGQHLLGVCPPADSTLLDFVRIFVRYAREHKSDAEENAAAAALLGLAKTFPCHDPADK
jgi:Rap1a immunity proteins